MDDKATSKLILLTYKNKALLMYKYTSAIDLEEHEWGFIPCKPEMNESIDDAILRRVKEETNIDLKFVEPISKSFYHARLTDDDVNNIIRAEWQLLDFFTLAEMEKLPLSYATKAFVMKYPQLIENFPRLIRKYTN